MRGPCARRVAVARECVAKDRACMQIIFDAGGIAAVARSVEMFGDFADAAGSACSLLCAFVGFHEVRCFGVDL